MFRIAALTLIALAACSGEAPTDSPVPFAAPQEGTPVSLRNATAEPIVYLAAGEGTLALLFIPPTLGPGEHGGQVVQPGETLPVDDIIGYTPELGVTFYVYRLDPTLGHGLYAGAFLATAAELARTGGIATLTPSKL